MTTDPGVEFTDAASAALDEYLAGMRRLIATTASEMSEQVGVEQVDAGLLFRATARVQDQLREGSGVPRRARMIRRLSILYPAVLAMILGVVLAISVTSEPIGVWSIVVIGGALVTVVVGMFSSMFVDVSGRIARLTVSLPTGSGVAVDSSIEFLGQWQQFERILRSIRLTEGVDLRKWTLGQQIQRVADAGLLTPAELAEVRELLRRRNELVHGELGSNTAAIRQDAARLTQLNRRLRDRASAMELEGETSPEV
jgi:hypothetical protein